ncbi:PepSY-associated TM helix domain-containing protein [Sphingomonas sp. CFBP 13603]|uniref:PepSY-associated TM helix domain-containing protein n=2 Tax=unclassified Sphingomonas TaxID=196159 RepID=UPI0018D8CEE2|nr:PepSY-associated TM helix domain-containing protein [Sphingomonas sp. CFBP 13603]
MATRPSLRVTMRRVHLWLGLTIGVLFAFAGLTGSLLVFYPEIDAVLSPALRAVPTGARPASWQAVVDTLHREHPARTGAWRIEVSGEGGAIPVRYYTPKETTGRAFAPLLAWVDPVRLTTIRTGFWGDTLVTWIYDLHYRLLLEEPGGIAMGIAGIVMLVLLASGIWAWWPRAGGWWRALRFKTHALPIRRLYDWHKLTGLAGLILLLVVTATGVMLDLPDQTRPIIASVSPLYQTPKPAVMLGSTRLTIDALIMRARRRFPDGALAWIETPATPTGAVRINLARPGEPSRRFPRTNVWFDPHDGRILAVRDGRAESGGDTVLNWLHPLHGGEAFGLTGRLLALVAGILPTILFTTGFMRWSRRRNNSERRTLAKFAGPNERPRGT